MRRHAFGHVRPLVDIATSAMEVARTVLCIGTRAMCGSLNETFGLVLYLLGGCRRVEESIIDGDADNY